MARASSCKASSRSRSAAPKSGLCVSRPRVSATANVLLPISRCRTIRVSRAAHDIRPEADQYASRTKSVTLSYRRRSPGLNRTGRLCTRLGGSVKAIPRRLRTMTSRRWSRSSDTCAGTRPSALPTYRSTNRSYVCKAPGFRRLTRLNSSSMSFWTGVAVRRSMYFFERPATNRQFTLSRFLRRCASSTMTKSHDVCWAKARWGSRFAVSIDAIRSGRRSQSPTDRRTANGNSNFDSISSCHCPVSEAGVRMRARRTRPRIAYSFSKRPASIVFPRPTSSARIARPRISRRTRMHVRSWCGYRKAPRRDGQASRRSNPSMREIRCASPLSLHARAPSPGVRKARARRLASASSNCRESEASPGGAASLEGRDIEGGIPSPAIAGGSKTRAALIIVAARRGAAATLLRGRDAVFLAQTHHGSPVGGEGWARLLGICPPPSQHRWKDREGVQPREPEIGRLEPLSEQGPFGRRDAAPSGRNDLRHKGVRNREGRDQDREVQANRVADVEEGRPEPRGDPPPHGRHGTHDRADVRRREETESRAEQHHVHNEQRIGRGRVRGGEEVQG